MIRNACFLSFPWGWLALFLMVSFGAEARMWVKNTQRVDPDTGEAIVDVRSDYEVFSKNAFYEVYDATDSGTEKTGQIEITQVHVEGNRAMARLREGEVKIGAFLKQAAQQAARTPAGVVEAEIKASTEGTEISYAAEEGSANEALEQNDYLTLSGEIKEHLSQ